MLGIYEISYNDILTDKMNEVLGEYPFPKKNKTRLMKTKHIQLMKKDYNTGWDLWEQIFEISMRVNYLQALVAKHSFLFFFSIK